VEKSTDKKLTITWKMRQVLGSKIRIKKLQTRLYLITTKENHNLNNVINEWKRFRLGITHNLKDEASYR